MSGKILNLAKNLYRLSIRFCGEILVYLAESLFALMLVLRYVWRNKNKVIKILPHVLYELLFAIRYSLFTAPLSSRRLVSLIVAFSLLTFNLLPLTSSWLWAATFEVVDKLSVINSSTLGDNANDFTIIRGSVTLQDSGEGVTESRIIFGQTNPPSLYRPLSGAVARTLYLDNNLIIGGSGGIRVSTITFTP